MKKTRISALIGALFPGIQGATPAITPYLGAMPDQIGLLTAMLSINPWQAAVFNAATNTTGFTATQSQIMSAEFTVLALTGTLGAGAALTLPTVATLISTLTPQQAVVGSTIGLRILNQSGGAFAWTVTTNTGWTLAGTQTIAQTTFRDFIITLTNVGATPTAVCQSVGGGTVV